MTSKNAYAIWKQADFCTMENLGLRLGMSAHKAKLLLNEHFDYAKTLRDCNDVL